MCYIVIIVTSRRSEIFGKIPERIDRLQHKSTVQAGCFNALSRSRVNFFFFLKVSFLFTDFDLVK